MLKLGQQMGLDAVFGPGAAAGAPGLDLAATVRAIMGAVFCDGGVIGVRMVLLKYRSFE